MTDVDSAAAVPLPDSRSSSADAPAPRPPTPPEAVFPASEAAEHSKPQKLSEAPHAARTLPFAKRRPRPAMFPETAVSPPAPAQ